MDDRREAKRALPSTTSPTQPEQLDSFTKLPPEILQSIFASLPPESPPPALSRRLLPYTRAARLSAVEITSFRQLELFARTLQEVAGVGAYTRSLTIALMDGTEAILAKQRPSLREVLLEALPHLPNVREVQSVDWLTTAFLLSEDAATGSTLRSMRSLRLSALLAQLNSTDFLTYRLVLLSRYPALRQLELIVLPYDPGRADATAFDLFPATISSDAAPPPPLDMQPISHLDHLTLGGPLLDQRAVNILRAFTNLREVTLFDSFASAHIAPALNALDPSALCTLRLQRLGAAPPPVNHAFADPGNSTAAALARFTALEELVLGMPMPESAPSGEGSDLAGALASLPVLRRIAFTSASSPSAALIHSLLTSSRPPALEALILSHITGEVGEPMTSAALPSIQLWVDALRAAQADPESTVNPVFPLLDWRLPPWRAEFTSADADALFPLARSVGIHLGGTIVSACLTTFVLERQLDVWTGGAAEEMSLEERAAIERRELWDALAIRYRGRLLGEEEEVQGGGEESMDMA
ncbi:hypothetical protein JCM10213_007263 [Rhodosporidiobolus nylandii]